MRHQLVIIGQLVLVSVYVNDTTCMLVWWNSSLMKYESDEIVVWWITSLIKYESVEIWVW